MQQPTSPVMPHSPQGAAMPGAGVAAMGGHAPLFPVNMRTAWALVLRERLRIAAIIGGALVLGLLSVLVMPKRYEAVASIQVEQQVAKVLGTEDTEPLASGIDAERFLQTQNDLLESRMMAERVAKALNLAANDDFLASMGASTNFVADGESRDERVVNVLLKNLSIELKRNSRIVTIGFFSRDPKIAAIIANTYAENFIENNIERKSGTSDYSLKFLKSQLDISKDRLESSERALIAYARSAHMIDASAGVRSQTATSGPKSLVTANLVDLNDRKAAAEAASLQAEQKWEAARNTTAMSLPEVLSNDAVLRLLQKRAELSGELKEMTARLKPDHPNVIQARAQLDQIDSQLQTLTASIKTSIYNQFVVAQRQSAAIAGQVHNLEQATLSEQDRSIRYNILNREVDTNRQLYESLLQRFKEVNAQSGVTSNNITLVDHAETPRKPTSPRLLFNLAVALVAGLAGAILLVLARERFANVVRNPTDVETLFAAPLLGVVPDVKERDAAALLDEPKSSLAEAYQSICNAVQLSGSGGMAATILVTGGGKSEGKSTTSLALARNFARIGKRVLLIDADLRRPSLNTRFGVDANVNGFSTVLAAVVPLDSAICQTSIENLSFLPAGKLPPDPASLFSGAFLGETIAAAASRFDLVLLDGPPVLALADAPALASHTEGTIFVVESGGTNITVLRRALARLQGTSTRILGVVLTKFDGAKEGYEYYVSDHYGY
jgi:capsular exopolysaccharide synthesis family protein